MNLSDLIYVKENVLDHEFCRDLIYKFNSDKRKFQGTVGSTGSRGSIVCSLNLSLKKCLDLNISQITGWDKEDKMLCKSFNKNVKDYFSYTSKFSPKTEDNKTVFGNGIRNFRDRGYLIRSYEKSDGYFNWHNDFSMDSQYGIRMLTLIWYLNDVDEGGETEFVDGTIVKPKTGQVLIFPTSWYMAHRGRMPISNKKYIITSWLYGSQR